MIQNLTIQRFKCFNNQKIEFCPLTLLVGANASGKSSVIQSLLLLKQSHQTGALRAGQLSLNGRLISVGTAKDVLYSQSQEDSLAFSLAIEQEEMPLTFEFAYPRGKPDAYALKSHQELHYPTINLFDNRVTYLTAERLGPRLLYPMTEVWREEMNVGIQGEHTAHCLAEFGQEAISNTNLLYPGSKNLSLTYQTQLWMRRIVPNLDIEIEQISQADQVRIGFKNQGISTDYLRPTNIGFGVSYTLPIVVGALMCSHQSMLIVENPEAHLHPASQSEMGQFLARAATAGIQVIIESHSDHILNGIRLAVKRQLLQAEEVSIQYFIAGGKKSEYQVFTPKMDSDGRIDSWPEGFFDQIEKDLLELL